ncbi:NAD-dependent epimerase/dehydratase family protein, partial [Pseudoalteromonas sp. SWYJZ12]|nr:NAD-dependent epimerase/dehydratase family protein [Pseudoalteromonas sp. SWYJZ12]
SSTALRLLQKGYKVRGTVRSLSSANYVKKEFASFGSNFELVEVPDIVAPNAFADAVHGADAVVHIASPVTMDAKKPEEQYVPAVDGSLNLMRTLAKEPSVKKLLFTGSIGSVIMTAKDPTKEVITPNDWNIATEQLANNLDDPLIGFHIYVGSKLVAEKAAWKFLEEEKPGFTMSSVLPAVSLGPIHKAITRPPRHDVSLGWLYDYIADPPRKTGASPAKITLFVHVFDVADIFVASLTSPEADGQRIIALGEKNSYAAVADILRKAYPDRKIPPTDPNEPAMGFPGAEVIQFDVSLGTKLLGGKWRSLEQMVLDGAKDLVEKEKKGWDK